MFKIGYKLTKENYTAGAIWCNNNHANIDPYTYEIIALSPIPESTYAEKRAAEYPPIPEQLDMLYWDSINGTNNWQTKISEIKRKYPKDENISNSDNSIHSV